eukprot:TRINITY_DN24986_c0_g1_i1.p1 TRINITY_DN24986_c0_g1~~TRINITY_DN24986_c0_g1_i1.p1  ORF type:complete len:295 (+),score=30.42 TRINITY_DN24986_c0_g1_i1:74-886(+)
MSNSIQGIVKKVAKAATRPKRRMLRRKWCYPPKLQPVMEYGECLDLVRDGSMNWDALFEYSNEGAPSPETVIEHVLEAHGMLEEQQWETAIRYLAIRCREQPHHYGGCKRRISDLLGRFEHRSPLLSSSMCGLAIFSGDAKGAVSIIKSSRTFHQSPFSWITFPPSLWHSDESNPLSRLHLGAVQYYCMKLSKGYPATLLALHSLFVYSIVQNDRKLFASIITSILSEYDRPPVLLRDTITLLTNSSSDMESVQPSLDILLKAGSFEGPA